MTIDERRAWLLEEEAEAIAAGNTVYGGAWRFNVACRQLGLEILAAVEPIADWLNKRLTRP